MANIWSILRDPAVYKNPNKFNPDRFLGPDPELDPMACGAFGFGRRICPGRHLAFDSTFITAASLVWAFKINPAKDNVGNPVLPDPLASHGCAVRCALIICVLRSRSLHDCYREHHFKCRFSPRFDVERVFTANA